MEQTTVLVIENASFLQDVYVAIFSHENYTVTIAPSYTEALEQLKQGTWDVVVLDMLYRGGINGLALLENYKRDPSAATAKKQPIYIVIVDDEEQAEKMRPLADAVFIATGFTPGDVLKTVQMCLLERGKLHPTAIG